MSFLYDVASFDSASLITQIQAENCPPDVIAAGTTINDATPVLRKINRVVTPVDNFGVRLTMPNFGCQQIWTSGSGGLFLEVTVINVSGSNNLKVYPPNASLAFHGVNQLSGLTYAAGEPFILQPAETAAGQPAGFFGTFSFVQF